MHSGTHTEISKLDLKIQPILHTVIEPTETITPATTTPQKWPPHESPTVAGTRELPALSLGFFGADRSGIGRGGNRLTRSCSQLQHHVEPDAGCQDSRRLAASPPHQEARHCPQVRRLRHQAPRCKLVCDLNAACGGVGGLEDEGYQRPTKRRDDTDLATLPAPRSQPECFRRDSARHALVYYHTRRRIPLSCRGLGTAL